MMLEHLLLGDLLELLLDAPGRQRDQWLLATLDMLLMTSRPRLASAVYLPATTSDPTTSDPTCGVQNRFGSELPVAFEKLQRLRDRIVHRAPHDVIANDLTADLLAYLECGARAGLN